MRQTIVFRSRARPLSSAIVLRVTDRGVGAFLNEDLSRFLAVATWRVSHYAPRNVAQAHLSPTLRSTLMRCTWDGSVKRSTSRPIMNQPNVSR